MQQKRAATFLEFGCQSDGTNLGTVYFALRLSREKFQQYKFSNDYWRLNFTSVL